MDKKQETLARCLFEAIDDISLSNIIVLLEKHEADPNTMINGIAPIHIIVGIDDLEFAQRVLRLFLEKRGNPNLYSESDKLTPLHVAALWGRASVVQILLDNGGDPDLKCQENKTPIMYAINENHYQVIEVITKFRKIEEKKKDLISTSQSKHQNFSHLSCEESFGTPLRKNHFENAIQSLDEKKFTPNRINYNFDATSPYYINITHRRHKSSNKNSVLIDVAETSNGDDQYENKNLFELTERNLAELSHQMSQVIVIDRVAIHKRRSYIKDWREKIQHIRKKEKHLDIDYINFLNTCNDVTLMNDPSAAEECDKQSSDDSFLTAKSNFQRYENAIQTLPEPCHYTEHVRKGAKNSELNTRIFRISESAIDQQAIKIADLDNSTRTCSTVSTKKTLPSFDYDTDGLRLELTNLTGRNPGPITKDTKRLYLKQLVNLKNQKPTLFNDNKGVHRTYSAELQRSISNYSYIEQNLITFCQLETQMQNHFLERSHIKWREGNMKTSFIYLLIDPTISDNLPLRYKELDKAEVWKTFLSSVFYVGKGKRSRPFSHLYDAIKLYSMENNEVAERLRNRDKQIVEKRVHLSNEEVSRKRLNLHGIKSPHRMNLNQLQDSKKLKAIVEIWRAQRGVVCLHIFNNIMPCEAYTREGAIIEAMNLNNLTNLKKGEYYGAAKNYSMRQKQQMGVGLLHRALNVYLAEGESQLMPFDLI